MNGDESSTGGTLPEEMATGMAEGATVSITRKLLYERVWAESVAHVGPKLGVWPRRLSTICATNKIPMPNRAYWYRSRSDRKNMIAPLPDPEQDWEIRFAPSQPGPQKPITDEREKIVVPDHLIRPHRLVREAKKAETTSVFEDGRRRIDGGYLKVFVSPPCRNRAFRLMNTLIKACEARGWSFRITKERWPDTIVDVEGCDVRVELVEGRRQEPRKLDQQEEKWEDGSRKRGPYKLVPNGHLTLEIEGVGFWHREQWGDRKHRRLEDMLDDIIAGIGGSKAAKIRHDKYEAEAKEKQLEKERLRREEEERQQELQRILMAEQARVDNLLADAEAWDQSQKLRKYINACLVKARASTKNTGRKIAPESKFGKWLMWARAQADLLDPLAGSPAFIRDV